MAKRAAWQTVASEIRRTQGVSWERARAIYRGFALETRGQTGHAPGLGDLRRSRRDIARLKALPPERLARVGLPTFEDRLLKLGIQHSALFSSFSKAFERLDVSPQVQYQLARVLVGAGKEVRKNGKVSEETKARVARWLALGAISHGYYFSLLRSLYGDD